MVNNDNYNQIKRIFFSLFEKVECILTIIFLY